MGCIHCSPQNTTTRQLDLDLDQHLADLYHSLRFRSLIESLCTCSPLPQLNDCSHMLVVVIEKRFVESLTLEYQFFCALRMLNTRTCCLLAHSLTRSVKRFLFWSSECGLCMFALPDQETLRSAAEPGEHLLMELLLCYCRHSLLQRLPGVFQRKSQQGLLVVRAVSSNYESHCLNLNRVSGNVQDHAHVILVLLESVCVRLRLSIELICAFESTVHTLGEEPRPLTPSQRPLRLGLQAVASWLKHVKEVICQTC